MKMINLVSFWNQYSFPDPMTEMAGRLYMYHDLVLVVLVMVLVLVGWFLMVFLAGSFFFQGSLNRFVVKNELLETVWTIVPSLFLGVLGYISLKNLYDMEVGENVDHVVKVTGHQWYWEYRYEVNFSVVKKGDHKECLVEWMKMTELNSLKEDEDLSLVNDTNDLESSEGNEACNNEDSVLWNSEGESENFLMNIMKFNGSVLNCVAELFMKGDWFLKYDSYLVPEGDLVNGQLNLNSGFRNQDVSAPCYLAFNKKNEVLVSTSDVMHSWGVSELGVKADAVPGRSNSLSVEPVSPGVSFGNCYELCGEGHSQMPVVVFVSNYDSIIWVIKGEIMTTESVEEFFSSI
uniref:Cytochrome c oxidase subunit 2 n=1 Tax=Dosinia troscheli TaxID=870214 RepID=A0A2S1U278_9BIVA|nr:cytochrome c oxidase subunit II [Dosinia troscheli]AWI68002.1 cytochrome c oxidase subunit II [Dosinia troscheli]